MLENIEKNYQVLSSDESVGGGLTWRDLITMLKLNWLWFVLSVVVCLVIAFVYIKKTPPVYSTYIKVLIKDVDPYTRRMYGSALADFSQLGLMNNTNGFDNEMEIIGSKTLALRSVYDLKLYVSYFTESLFRKNELYGNSPVLADMAKEYLDTLAVPVNLKITPVDNGYEVKGKALDQDFEAKVASLPTKVKTPSGWVSLRPNPVNPLLTEPVEVLIINPEQAADIKLAQTSIEPTSKMTTIVRVTVLDTQYKRAQDYLNELINAYNEDANENKNEVALKTDSFINERIRMVSTDLGLSDTRLEGFKKSNRLIDLTSDADAAYKGLEDYQKQQVELQTQLMLVQSLQEYIQNPKNAMSVIPANMGVSDAGINESVRQYNEYIINRARMLKSASENSPAVVAVTNAIEAMRPGIQHSLQSIYDNLHTRKMQVDEQYRLFMGRLSAAPTQEKNYSQIERQREIQAALFQILLQKREENSISLASRAAKGQVVDKPETGKSPVAPRSKVIMLAALVLGCAIPFGILYLMNMLRYRIEGREDVEKLTNIPILCDIYISDKEAPQKRSIVVTENANGMMEETFRNLRTNLGFIINKNEKVVMCTSVIPGEGKTFVSTNLAMSLALMGKKVLVVGLDIRKPRLAKLFKLHTGGNGLTTYLVSDDHSDENLRNQIFNSRIHKNLDVLPAGLIPPNPNELLSSDRLDYTFARLKEWYDIIVVDTPPLGLVSDTLLLARLANATLVVCRCDYSYKRNFELINQLSAEKKLPKINLVLNGIDLTQKKYQLYYGYGQKGRGGRYGFYGTYGDYNDYNDHKEGGSIEESEK